MALLGFARTWRDNSEGRPFLSGYPRLYRGWNALRSLVSKPEPSRGSGGGSFSVEGRGFGISCPRIDDSMTADAKAVAAHETAVKALKHASQAHAAVGREEQARSQSVKALEARVLAVENAAAADLRRFAVEGIPLAVVGLGLAVLGLVAQGLATWATWS